VRKCDVDLFAEYHRVRVQFGSCPESIRLRNQIVAKNILLAYEVFNRFWGSKQCNDCEDLKQVALIGLIKAVEGFDITRGVSFGCYAVPRIRGEMAHYVRDKMLGVRSARAIEYALKKQDITEAEARRQKYLARNAWSLSTRIKAADDSCLTLQDTLADTDPYDAEEVESLHQEIDRLPEPLKAVAQLRSRGTNYKEIAKLCGISAMTVTRRLTRACQWLQKTLTI
jgi:RNA polymerase sigma-B factor